MSLDCTILLLFLEAGHPAGSLSVECKDATPRRSLQADNALKIEPTVSTPVSAASGEESGSPLPPQQATVKATLKIPLPQVRLDSVMLLTTCEYTLSHDTVLRHQHVLANRSWFVLDV